MPEVNPQPKRQVLAAAMFVSSVVLIVLAMLFYTGVVAVAGEIRIAVATVLAVAAVADLLIALWFFRQGQSQ